MAIKPKRDHCGKELKQFGAILFSPPNKQNEVKKFHFCQACYRSFVVKYRRGNNKK